VGEVVWFHVRASPENRPRLPRACSASSRGRRHRHQFSTDRTFRTASALPFYVPILLLSSDVVVAVIDRNVFEPAEAHLVLAQPVESGVSKSGVELESCMVLLLGCFEKLFLLDDLFAPDCAALRKAPPSPPHLLVCHIPSSPQSAHSLPSPLLCCAVPCCGAVGTDRSSSRR
jgi:hypothetical protein